MASKFASWRMKTTMIVKKALDPRLDAGIDRLCSSGKFSLTTDESNDQGGEKALVILARMLDPAIERQPLGLSTFQCANIFDVINTIPPVP